MVHLKEFCDSNSAGLTTCSMALLTEVSDSYVGDTAGRDCEENEVIPKVLA